MARKLTLRTMPVDYRGKKTIIVGEVNTGKTALLSETLQKFLDEGETNVAVIDLAPEIFRGIGGKMAGEALDRVRYYTTEVLPPRLMGKTAAEVLALAEQNARRIEDLFGQFAKSRAKVLLINDVSLYLQAGDIETLWSLAASVPTVIMNGYLGSSLGGGDLSERERRNMEALQERCDRVVKL